MLGPMTELHPCRSATAIKICGVRDAATVNLCISLGVEMIGLVLFPPSPRAVDVAAAEALAGLARGRTAVVALTVDADDALLEAISERVRPDWLQFHGHELPQRIADVRARTDVPVIKAIGIATEDDLTRVGEYRAAADTILLDARAPVSADRPGGHGRPFDWTLLARLDPGFRYVLSGGLSADNITEAVRRVRPAAVDVSSGVEREKGVKDARLIRNFVTAVRAATNEVVA